MAMKRAKSFLVLGFLLLIISCCLSHVTSLSFNYNFSDPAVLGGADLKYLNDSAPTVDRIDLTNQSRWWSTGRVAHGQALRLWDDSTGKVASFTSNFVFAIRPANSHPKRADGMAFFVGPYPPVMPTDARAGHLGLFNNRDHPGNDELPRTVGVEFDTIRNPDWDPLNTNCHIGIDVNSITSREYTALPDGIFNGIMSAVVRYDAKAGRLSATLRFDDPPPPGQRTYRVSADVDLRDAGLPQDAAVGFSAATGNFDEQHQILSWSFQSTMTQGRP